MASCTTSLLQLASEPKEVGGAKRSERTRWLKQTKWQSVEVVTSLGQEGGGGGQDPSEL